ncbi:MAG TPA: FlgD immunoglobulin-like domain containing protein [Candidatus Eisenbacteria bacterium]|nr:FlgD immunoglobulin-like domain containing protein [Candidatus Eisenbacteria bacterium]
MINPNHDPNVTSPLLTRAPSSINYLRIGMRNKGGNEEGQLYYSAPGLPPAESRSRSFTNPNNGRYNWITIRLDDIPSWSGASNIDRIRIDPVRTDVPVSGNDDVLIDYIFFRRDATNPTQPTITDVLPSGWTNVNSFTVSFTGNDPPPEGLSAVGPDVYGSGVNDFKYRVVPNSDATKLPDSFNDITGDASATVTVAATQQGPNEFVVYSFDKTAHPSVARTATLYYDSTLPPTVGQPGVTPSGWTATNSFSFSWGGVTDTHSGVNRYEYRIDGGSPVSVGTATSAGGALAPSVGPHSFEVRAVDNAGNAGTWSTARSFFFDNAAPPTVAQPGATPSGWTATNSFSFSWGAVSDAHSGLNRYEYRIDGGSAVGVGTATSVGGVPAPSAGTHSLEVRAVDNAGNAGAWSTAVSFYFDNVAPPTVGQPGATPSGWTATNSFSFSWVAITDAHSGVNRYEYRIDGGSAVSVGVTTSVGNLQASSPGQHSFEVRAIDNVDIVGAWSTARSFFFDDVAPSSPGTPVASPAGYSSLNDFTLSWSAASDVHSGVSGYDYRINGGAVASTAGLSVNGALATQEGANLFEVRSRDQADNVSGWEQTQFFYDASPPPSPVLTGNPPACSAVNSFTVSWPPVSDPQGIQHYEYRLGGGSISSTSQTSVAGIVASQECGQAFEVRAVDGVGNLSPWASVNLCWDGTAPPALTLAVSPPGWTTTNNFTVSWSAVTDGCSGLFGYCSHVGSPGSETCNTTLNRSGALARFEGTDTIFVSSRDQAGNSSPAAIALLRFDATAPTATVDPLPAITTTPSFVVHWRGADNASGLVSFDVQFRDSLVQNWTTWKSGTTSDSALFGAGDPIDVENGHTYFFRARARDVAGNLGTYPVGQGQAKTHVLVGVTAVTPQATAEFNLDRGAPNPLFDRTTLRFSLPQAMSVALRVYDIRGNLVRTLGDRGFEPGPQAVQWDATDDRGARVAAGVYFFRLEAPGRTLRRKLVVLQ